MDHKLVQSPSAHWHFTIVAVFLGSILFSLLYILKGSSERKIPTINDKRAFEFSNERIKKNFALNGRQLLQEGLRKFSGKPFRILTDSGPIIILSPEYVHELRNDGNLNHAQAIAKVG